MGTERPGPAGEAPNLPAQAERKPLSIRGVTGLEDHDGDADVAVLVVVAMVWL